MEITIEAVQGGIRELGRKSHLVGNLVFLFLRTIESPAVLYINSSVAPYLFMRQER
jgi:hypothetical protein